MKIELDKDNSIEVKINTDEKINLVFKTKKSDKTTVILTAELTVQQVEDLIAGLITLKIKAK